MTSCQILIVGGALLARGISKLLGQSESLQAVCILPSTGEVLEILDAGGADAVIFTEMGRHDMGLMWRVLTSYPELPVICVDLNSSQFQAITVEQMPADSASLQAALTRALEHKMRKS